MQSGCEEGEWIAPHEECPLGKAEMCRGVLK